MPVVDVEPVGAEFVGEAAHRGDHEVGTLAVPPLPGDLGRALDHQDAV